MKMLKLLFVMLALLLIAGCLGGQRDIKTVDDIADDVIEEVTVDDVEDVLQDLEDLDQELNMSELDDLEKELEDINFD